MKVVLCIYTSDREPYVQARHRLLATPWLQAFMNHPQVETFLVLGNGQLVAPRLIASIIVMPILGSAALILGFSGAMLITDLQFGIPAPFFLGSALNTLTVQDYLSGMLKTPFFGAVIAIVACHYGLRTRGGTAGVGHNTTTTVVVTSIVILVLDLLLTKLAFALWGFI